MYTLIDLIDKFIEIEEKAAKFYEEISTNMEYGQQIRITSKIFFMEELRHAKVYRELKSYLLKEDDIEIEFSIYDKSYKILKAFSTEVYKTDILNSQQLVKIASEMEKENLALALSVQGIMVQNKVNELAYSKLSNIIREEEEHVHNINLFIAN